MRIRYLIILLALFSVSTQGMAQEETTQVKKQQPYRAKLDTIYYDENWKGVDNRLFATYYRVYNPNDTSSHKKYQDYYITGELQSKGEWITINKSDDSKSQFDGDWATYYKSGQLKGKGSRTHGIQQGEFTEYYENGLIHKHAYFKDGLLHGIVSEFDEAGEHCIQQEFANGERINDYYVISNKEGGVSKFSLTDNKPIYETPDTSERKVEYHNGMTIAYYIKNGIVVAMRNSVVQDYGTWYRLNMVVKNNSVVPIDFDPEQMIIKLNTTNNKEFALNVLSSEEYLKKVRRSQAWSQIAVALSEGLAASQAGYSSSTSQTNSSYSGASSSYSSASVVGSGGYAYGSGVSGTSYAGSSSSTTTTTSYNGAAAYQAKLIASARIADYANAQYQEQQVREEGYLKKTTLAPGEAISGYVNIKRKKGNTLSVVVDIKGAKYEFLWDVSKK